MSVPVFTNAQIQKIADLYASGYTSVTINGRTVQISGDLLARIHAMQEIQAQAAASVNRGNAIRGTFRRS